MSKVPDRQHAVNIRTAESGGSGADSGLDSGVSDRPRRTPAGDAFSGLAFRVLRLAGLLAAAGDALARPVGQSTARWQVLAAVESQPASVAGIARALGLARQSVQRVADALEAGGLVAFEDNPRHRRARLVRLTPEGRAVLAAIQAAQAPWADARGAKVGTEKLERANRVLDQVLASFAGAGDRSDQG
jgi:DNA-binding MarR family transcriptional regulator